MTVDDIIGDILAREGTVYTDVPGDRGGPTKFGVTLDTLSTWRAKPCTAEDVKLLSQEEARAIYRSAYIVAPGFLPLPDPLRALLVDSGVNHGTGRAVKWLQKALGVAMDGALGPATAAAIATADASAVYRRVLADRVRFYGRLITDNPAQAKFAAGWASRAASFVEMVP